MARHKQQPGIDAKRAAEAGLKSEDTSQAWRLEQIKWKPDGSHIINFGQIYLKRWFRSASPDFHREIIEFHLGNQVSIIETPRGHAKTTLERTICLYDAVTFGRDDLVPPEHQSDFDAFVAKIEPLAEMSTKAVKRQLESNRLLKEDFGNLRGNKTWEKGEFECSNGYMLYAVGYGGTSRGLLGPDGQRPRKVFVDDLVDYRISRNPEQMYERFLFIKDDIMGLGTGEHKLRILITGNRMSRHDHMGLLKAQNKWPYKSYKAVLERDDKGRITKVLWPEVQTLAYLREQEDVLGSRMFRKVYENVILDDDEFLFSFDDIQRDLFFGDPHAIEGTGYWYSDPAKSKNRKGDFAVELYGKLDKDKTLWVVGGNAEKVRKLTKIARSIISINKDFGVARLGGIETNGVGSGLPELLDREAKDQGYFRIRWIEISHNTDKRLRIESLQPGIEGGKDRIHHSLQFLIDNLRDYPDVPYDDPADALAGLVETVEKSIVGGFSGGIRLVGRDVMGRDRQLPARVVQ